MDYLETYLETIKNRGNPDLAESVNRTSTEIGNKYLKEFSFSTHEIGLLLGNIQSGKTAQMFGVISEATDLGFPVFLLLTTDNVILQQQTLDRVKDDLKGYCICGENDAGMFNDNQLIKPAIIVLKKNHRMLRLWSNILRSTGFMRGNPLFIVDDEADASSLNTKINQHRQSTINGYIEAIRNDASCSLYLQVTGTPQAIFLQTYESRWHPSFVYYFNPGKSYLGGNFFFSKDGVPSCISFLEDLRNPIREVVVRHIAVSAQIFLTNGRVSNCLFHPSVRTAIHNGIARDVNTEIEWCRTNREDGFKELLKKQYDEMNPSKAEKQSFESIYKKAVEMLEIGELKVLIMNGKSKVESKEYSTGCNFIVGGNTLGRGVTFPALQTLYYTRTSKNPQADTMWQHSRMFGYDRDPGMMKVFIDERLYSIFSSINATNNSIIAQIKKGVDKVQIYYPPDIKSTRSNVLDHNCVISITGGTNYYPYNPENDSVEKLSELLHPFSEEVKYYQVSLKLIDEILSHIQTGPDFKISSFRAVINSMLAEKSTAQGILIVRRNRDITQGTGALLSPNDWNLGEGFGDKIVLTMYQVTGTKGWSAPNLWVPNIKLPDNIVYYDVEEEM